MEQINIVSVSDNQYAEYMAVMIQSILMNGKDKSFMSFYIIDCGIQKDNLDILSNVVEAHHCEINFIRSDYSKCKDFQVHGHISHAAYVKLQMPSLLHDLNKIIYLDGDLIVLDDLAKLWSCDVKNAALCAAGNPKTKPSSYINVPADKKVFNSGVMIIHLDRWREEKIEEKTLNYLKENSHKLKFHDQAAFNAVLYDRWSPLEAKWNVQSAFYNVTNLNTIYSESEIISALQNPSIVHFTSNSKPWQFRNGHPYKKKFIEYYKEVFGRKPKYRDVNLISFLKRVKEEIEYL